MELNITELFNDETFDTLDYQDSIASSGNQNIGELTWRNAMNSEYIYVNEDNAEEIRDYFLGYGAWSEEELSDNKELNALLIQEIANNMQSYNETREDEDAYASRIYKSEDNQYYIYIGE